MNKLNCLFFGGKSSGDFGLYISGSGTFNAPERDVTRVEVPGRCGDLLIDNGRYKNISVSYPAYIRRNFARNAAAARAWLLSVPGYSRLEDDYDPEHFRMAAFSGPLEFDMGVLNRTGKCSIVFNCKPQRFRKDGELPITFAAGGVINNPTDFPSFPLITIHGTGAATLSIAGYTVRITDIGAGIVIDCDTQNAYWDTSNRNNAITVTDFPQLPPGPALIGWTGDITNLEIIPRWWTI